MKLLFFAAALLFVTVSGAHAQDQANVVASCGSVTLTAGTSSFRTIDLTGQTCNSGGGGIPIIASTWSLADALANGMTLSNGGSTVTTTGTAYQSIRGTSSRTTGKYYIEFKSGASMSGNDDPGFGLADATFNPAGYLSQTAISVGLLTGATHANLATPSVLVSNYTTSVLAQANDVWAMAVDLATGNIWLAQNNVWFGSGNPATAGNPMATMTAGLLSQTYFPAMTIRLNGAGSNLAPIWTLQPTAASQKYAPPAGFVAWDSAP